jgi:prophage regulatory protein
MNIERSETAPGAILRLTEVIRRTGLSRSTLYNRIATRQFPHQVSLGGRAVGWVRAEVEDWIAERTKFRPGQATSISQDAPRGPAIPKSIRSGRPESQRSTEPTKCIISSENDSPNPAQLHLVGTKIYYDKSTGSFWLKLLPEDPTRERSVPEHER